MWDKNIYSIWYQLVFLNYSYIRTYEKSRKTLITVKSA